MRCYLMRGGHIVAVKEFPGLSDQDAIEQGRLLFEEHSEEYDDFEIWDHNRKVYQHSRREIEHESE